MKQYKICYKKTVNANSSEEALDKGVKTLLAGYDLYMDDAYFYEIFDVMEIHDNSSDDDDNNDEQREPRYDSTDLD